MAGALDGVKVLDLTQALAGPFATLILGHLGADVINVERPETGDTFRHIWLPQEVAAKRDAYEFQWVGIGKRSVGIDIQTTEGKDLFKGLARWADIVVENYSLGVMDRLGLGYEVLKEENPRLIYATIKGFGLDGPYAPRHAAAPIPAGMVGWTMANWENAELPRGETRGVQGTRTNAPSDEVSGASAGIGQLAALYSREKSGVGQLVEISMQEAVAAWMVSWYHEYFEQYPVGNAPMRCKDGWYNFTGVLVPDRQWPILCTVMGREDLRDDERFTTVEGRKAHSTELDDVVENWMLSRTRSEVWEALEPLGGVNGPIYEVSETFDDPHLKDRSFFVEAPNQEGGTWPMAGPWIRMSGTPASIQRWSPNLGEHTDSVMREISGLTENEIGRLRELGVLG